MLGQADVITTRSGEGLPSASPDTWLEWASRAGPLRIRRTARAVPRAYEKAGFHPPRHILVTDSPLSGAIVATIVREGNGCTDWRDCGAFEVVAHPLSQGADWRVRQPLRSAMRCRAGSRTRNDQALGRLIAAIWSQAAADVWGSLLDPLLDRAWQRVNRQLWGGATTRLCCSLRDELREEVCSGLRTQLQTQVLAPRQAKTWSRCMDGLAARGFEQMSQLEYFLVAARHCCWWSPFPDVAILQHPPCELHLNVAGAVHRDGGPAVLYRDGFALWMLNGVHVPGWLAETRDTKIDPRRVLGIRNVDVRREFVRKVGVDRVCYSLNAACLDRRGNYELLNLDLGDGQYRPYLKMLNPSIGTYHVEGVDPRCRTVAHALAWRNGTNKSPEVLT